MKKVMNEYNAFSNLAKSLMAVSHGELKAKLDEEKKAKASKAKHSKKATS